jgi:PIN domain nuclease of toxin-antitoxin system
VRLLLDTHALLWWLSNDASLSSVARRNIARGENQILISAASAWEIGTKVRLGKLPGAEDLAANFSAHLARERFEELPISVDHGIRAALLPGTHRDPFGRMLIAQCQAESVPIVSADTVFDRYSVRRLW